MSTVSIRSFHVQVGTVVEYICLNEVKPVLYEMKHSPYSNHSSGAPGCDNSEVLLQLIPAAD